jgi:hypothetical protein
MQYGGVQTIVELLGRACFPLSSETACQQAIETLFAEHFPGVEILREHRLSARDRPDFFAAADGVAIEVKVGGRGQQRAAIIRQLARYAEHDQVKALVLVTGVSMPRIELAKPVHVVSLGRAWL